MLNSVVESRTKEDRPRVTQMLADWVASAQYSDLPTDIAEFAKRAMADTLGCAIAACAEHNVQDIIRTVGGEKGAACIWGTALLTTARNAALINGTMAHTYDFDDNNRSMFGHPSAPVIPAVMAIADESDVTGEEVILAYLLGVEVEGKLGQALTYEHNGRGWHTTPTIGAIGAAAAASKLLRLTSEQTRNALGIAVSMAGGVRQNFGTDTKALHVGMAAQNGGLAARLAANGVTASPSAIEGHEGFFDMFTARDVIACDQAISQLGTKFEILNNVPKIYSSCSAVHTAVDIALAGLQSQQIKVDDIKSIRCRASYHALNLMRYGVPKSHAEARFSIPYCIAASLIFGKLGIAEFSESAVSDPQVLALTKKVEVEIIPELSTQELFEKAHRAGEAFTVLEVVHQTAPIYEERAMRPKGHPKSPLSTEDFHRKFIDCVSLAFSRTTAEKTWQSVLSMEKMTHVKPSALLSQGALHAANA